MKTLRQAVKVRDSVYNKKMKDEVLDLSDLKNSSINPERFFKETFITDNMETVFDTAMNKFRNRSGNSIIKLTQAMGGGKTHNMIALGLLAKYPHIRKEILNGKYSDVEGDIRTIAITGRESDMEYGTWGEIAKQLGKKEQFSEYYSPLQSPGQTAWVKLLESSTPTLILLDELPPYLSNAKTRPYGKGTLLDIEKNAIANLLNAINRKELSNVCLVISDLEATYEEESELIHEVFTDLEGEINRFSINLEPVSSNSNDLYEILKTRMFESLPEKKEINSVARAFQKSVKEAVDMGYSDEIPGEIASLIRKTYPFHPSFKELIERFKENQDFQKTRGVIRFTKKLLQGIFKDTNKADNQYLINPFDINLKNSNMANEIKSIKPELTNAISHDISNNGHSVAEQIDNATDSEDIQDVAKLVLMSSLSKATEAITGLSESEIYTYLSSPDRDITKIKGGIEVLREKAWYLYKEDKKLVFNQTKNVIAAIQDRTQNTTRERAKLHVKSLLKEKLEPKNKDCYQKLLVFPSIEEIELHKNKTTLIVTEPSNDGQGLKEELRSFFKEIEYKNRVLFITGQKNVMNNLINRAKRTKAIDEVIREMRRKKVDERNSEMKDAIKEKDKNANKISSSLTQAFTTIYFPRNGILKPASFKMNFTANNFNAEEEIKKTLINEMKFEENIEPKEIRDRFERVIFTRDKMPWNELVDRTATNTSWIWHHPNALSDLKRDSLDKEIWFEDGNYLDKTPPKKTTSVNITKKEFETRDNTVLQITPINADTVYYEIGQKPTKASKKVENLSSFEADELIYYFLAVDSTEQNKTGEAVKWINDINLKYQEVMINGKEAIKLEAFPKNCEIRYTTDGSSPLENGGLYSDREIIIIPENAKYIQAVAVNTKHDITSEVLRYKVKDQKVTVQPNEPVKLTKVLNPTGTKFTYEALDFLKDTNAEIGTAQFIISGKADNDFSITLMINNVEVDSLDSIEKELQSITNNLVGEKKYDLTANLNNIEFPTGRDFLKWLEKNEFTLELYKNDFLQH